MAITQTDNWILLDKKIKETNGHEAVQTTNCTNETKSIHRKESICLKRCPKNLEEEHSKVIWKRMRFSAVLWLLHLPCVHTETALGGNSLFHELAPCSLSCLPWHCRGGGLPSHNIQPTVPWKQRAPLTSPSGCCYALLRTGPTSSNLQSYSKQIFKSCLMSVRERKYVF